MLSEREQQILVLVAQGLSNKQIALQLAISENTVKVHVRNIFAKINVASRTEASLYAVRHGLLDVAPPAPLAPPVPPTLVYTPWWWLAVGVVVLAAVAGYWWFSREKIPTQAAIPTRWRMLAALPVAAQGVQFVSYDGVLYAVAPNQWWHLDAAESQWQAGESLPCQVTHARLWADGSGIWLVGCTNREVWQWDGQTWLPHNALPADVLPQAVFRSDGVLWIFTQQDIWKLASATTWQHVGTLPRVFPRMQLASVDGVVYVFGDGDAVWRVDMPTAQWRLATRLPFSWQDASVSTVLGSVLIADAQTATLWAYIPSRGVVSAQMVPPQVRLGTQAIQWQAYVVFPNDDGSVIPAYQAVFQTFVPVLRDP